ncbi:MAG: AmpG family muropeptide MFS transporter [Bdellovibrio sp.]|nr:AmpG family muropeptide MFS transporter [Bdellovibrio sp.]
MKKIKSILQVFANKRMFIVLVNGFTSGVPLALTAGTLQAWMKDKNVDLTTIGIFSLVGIPYTLKFLWAPVMDRFVPAFLGRRRGWLLISQIALAFFIAMMAFAKPLESPFMLAFLAVLVAFSSASQDIVIDAYRTEILNPEELGVGAGTYIMGYRIGMLVSGAVALILADHFSWKSVYLIMSGTIVIGILMTFFSPEPKVREKPPKTLSEAVILPFVDFLKRKGSLELLAFILFYKLDVIMTMALMTPFLMQIEFSKSDIGYVLKGFGLVATIVGSLVGGAWMVRLGMKKSLWVFGLLQGFSGLSFVLLSYLGHNYVMMITALTLENLCSGMGTAVFSAFLMHLCNQKFTATQYALLTSFMALSRVFMSAPCGYVAEQFGWHAYYIVSVLIAIPGLMLLTRYDQWQKTA